jgi:hypothetical protein
LLACSGAALVAAVGALAWFDTVYRLEARAIEGAADRLLKQALTRLREHRKKGRTLPSVPLQGKMYGVTMMANWAPLGRSWRSDLERVLAASVVTAAAEENPVVFLCHRIEGRNARDQSSEHVSLVEVLRWRLAVDAQGQGWARPSTGGGYHWDVYLTAQAEDRIGLAQINITQHGAPAGQGRPGDLHHVPKDKRPRLRDQSGWRCPP